VGQPPTVARPPSAPSSCTDTDGGPLSSTSRPQLSGTWIGYRPELPGSISWSTGERTVPEIPDPEASASTTRTGAASRL
jgi:hypothetical protein